VHPAKLPVFSLAPLPQRLTPPQLLHLLCKLCPAQQRARVRQPYVRICGTFLPPRLRVFTTGHGNVLPFTKGLRPSAKISEHVPFWFLSMLAIFFLTFASQVRERLWLKFK
jgi:hypothetical protein